jgi:hypothetical protein
MLFVSGLSVANAETISFDVSTIAPGELKTIIYNKHR